MPTGNCRNLKVFKCNYSPLLMKRYITCAIDYTNGRPHMGHAYEKIVADALARWYRIKGEEVFFSIGTDEHGQKVYQTAEKQGSEVNEFVEEVVASFKQLMKQISISHDRFIRTSDADHKKRVKDLIKKAEKDIYKGEYEGWYCWGCEAYYTEQQAPKKICPECGKKVEQRKEETYFFKLSAYQKEIIAYLQKDVIFPNARKNEMLSRLKEPLKDLSITRRREKLPWGIDFPLDKDHVVYVWFDALANYLSSPKNLEEVWPACAHVVGKDILWFHAVIWPAMLLSTGYELPQHIFAHGFINDKKGGKMSKSVGNVVDPKKMVEQHGVDAFRYYLLRTVVAGEDGNFDENELIERYNGELANELGNLVQRVKKLVLNYYEGKIENESFTDAFSFSEKKIDTAMNTFSYHKAIEHILADLHTINAYVNDKAPWKNEEERKEVLYNVLEGIRYVTTCFSAFIPDAAQRIAETLGFEIGTLPEFSFGDKSYTFSDAPVIFPKIEQEKKDEFALDLRVGRIERVEPVEGADKLFVEQVDLGTEKRQIVSGLAKSYTPEELVGKHIIVVCNLKKAKLKGVESYGMLLAAEEQGKLIVVEAPKSKPGDAVLPKGKVAASTKIKFDDFLKLKLEIKDKQLLADGDVLKTEKENITLDVSDGNVA